MNTKLILLIFGMSLIVGTLIFVTAELLSTDAVIDATKSISPTSKYTDTITYLCGKDEKSFTITEPNEYIEDDVLDKINKDCNDIATNIRNSKGDILQTDGIIYSFDKDDFKEEIVNDFGDVIGYK